jgi:hypothetical protein
MALRDARAFGRAWDLLVERAGDQQKITVSSGGQTVMTGVGPAGKTYSVTFLKQTNSNHKSGGIRGQDPFPANSVHPASKP